jgi:hypothetical protein
VEIYAAVRRFVFVEGNSRREAVRGLWIEPRYDQQDVQIFSAAQVTESRKRFQFLGGLPRKKSSVASANCPPVAERLLGVTCLCMTAHSRVQMRAIGRDEMLLDPPAADVSSSSKNACLLTAPPVVQKHQGICVRHQNPPNRKTQEFSPGPSMSRVIL